MNSEEEVRSRLSSLPSQGIPDHVARAVHARLAAESSERARGAHAEVVPITRKHRSRLNGLMVAAAAAAFAMLMAVSVQSPGPPVAQGQAPVVKAGAIYEPTDFADEVRERFLTAQRTTSPTNTFADSPAGIEACAHAVSAYGAVLTVDTGSYDDLPAAVVITTYPINTEYEEIWVVTPGCGTTSSQVIGHMVLDVDNSTANL